MINALSLMFISIHIVLSIVHCFQEWREKGWGSAIPTFIFYVASISVPVYLWIV